MNYLGIDFGEKNIGIAISIKSIITPLKIFKNTKQIFSQLQPILNDYQIDAIILGYTQSLNLPKIKKFQTNLEKHFQLKVILADENFSTREAKSIVKKNLNFQKKYLKKPIDAVSAAVILSRVLV